MFAVADRVCVCVDFLPGGIVSHGGLAAWLKLIDYVKSSQTNRSLFGRSICHICFCQAMLIFFMMTFAGVKNAVKPKVFGIPAFSLA